ncbi:hypothetical protein Rhopal_002004-T1 [Rhodotorula paludigena]|uniref:Amine oxidase domain-containing protein n=1 Tax=Rhodotorula paludigena TaxID=86838 RepID=A0AAV5G951_9BASI|nr:hypothetical protein Rhopal_002004-T1 [Rhodotorula paludigena]
MRDSEHSSSDRGLATAHFLRKAAAHTPDHAHLRIDVHLLEKNDSLGMDAASLSVKSDQGSSRVDVPMRSINGGSHARVKKLYEYLGVPLVRSDFTYSFSRIVDPPHPPSRTSSGTTTPDARPPPPSRPPSEASIAPSTPPPQYLEHEEAASSQAESAKPSHLRQLTTFIYEGASGLRFPPISYPSHLKHAPIVQRVAYIVSAVHLAAAYLYLLLLAFFYVSLGLAQPPPERKRSAGSRISSRVPLRNVASEPLLDWCRRHRIPSCLTDDVLVPLMAGVATVGTEEAEKMPVGEVLQYITTTFASSHFVTHPDFGVRGIVQRMAAPIPNECLHVGVDIDRIEVVAGDGYRLHYQQRGEAKTLEVDHLIFATQADQAVQLLSSMTPAAQDSDDLERTLDALRQFAYTRTLVVTHTDASLLPSDTHDQRDLNLAVFSPRPASTPQSEWDESLDYVPPTSVQTTHVLHRSATPLDSFKKGEARAPSLILQTTNPVVPIPPQHVLSSTWFSRAFVTPASQAVLSRFKLPSSPAAPSADSLQGLALGRKRRDTSGRVWFVGSYVADGIPLLEGCVASAEGAVRDLIRREGATVTQWAF